MPGEFFFMAMGGPGVSLAGFAGLIATLDRRALSGNFHVIKMGLGVLFAVVWADTGLPEGVVKTFRSTGFARFANRATSAAIRARIMRGPYVVLTVPGRRTGLPRSTPLEVVPVGDGWRVTAAYGLVDWVKNLQASRTAMILVSGREFPVTSEQLPRREAAVILRERMASASRTTMRMIGPYFDVTPESPLEAWELEADHHPIFMLRRI